MALTDEQLTKYQVMAQWQDAPHDAGQYEQGLARAVSVLVAEVRRLKKQADQVNALYETCGRRTSQLDEAYSEIKRLKRLVEDNLAALPKAWREQHPYDVRLDG